MPRGKRVPDRRNTDISHVVPRSKRLSNMRRVIISSPTQHIILTSTLCQLTSDDSLLQMWFYVSPGSSARIPPGPGNALRDASYFNANGFCSNRFLRAGNSVECTTGNVTASSFTQLLPPLRTNSLCMLYI